MKPSAYGAAYKSKYQLEPTTLPDLMKRAGSLADAARAYVEWGAITVWQMHSSKGYQDAIASAGLCISEVSRSVSIAIQAQRHVNGWPILSGKGVTPALYGLPTDAQCEARQVAARVYALWEQAGRPHVDARRCKFTYQYLVACVASGLIDPLPGIKATDIPVDPAPARPKWQSQSHYEMQQLMLEQENQ